MQLTNGIILNLYFKKYLNSKNKIQSWIGSPEIKNITIPNINQLLINS